MTLTNLKIGETAIIKKLCSKDSALANELQELGFVPGTPVTLKSKGLFRDPLAFEIRGTTFALRKNEAKAVLL